MDELPLFAALDASGGQINRSDSVRGWRQSGQQALARFMVFKMHDLQKICPQQVMTPLVGGKMQIGQSMPSSSCSAESIFSNNCGLLCTSSLIQLLNV